MTEDELGHELQSLFSVGPSGPEAGPTQSDLADPGADDARDNGLRSEPTVKGAYDAQELHAHTAGEESRIASEMPVPSMAGNSGSEVVEQGITDSLAGESERMQSAHQQITPFPNSTSPYQPRSGDLIDGRYKVIELLGCGSFAEVYKCIDVHLEQKFAVKVMGLVSGTADVLREARIAARLQHPNILRVVNIGRLKETGSWYIVMDYKEGSQTLETVLDEAENRLRRLPLNDQSLQIVSEVADALEYAHAAGVIHQDVKPSNVVIDQEGHAYLTDFGLAMAKRSSGGSMKTMDAQNGLSGTIPYMAPEQFEELEGSGELTPGFDIYSLAVVAYEMLVGQLPYPGKATGPIIRQIVEGVRTPPRQLNAEIPREVENVLLQSLSPDPKDRCRSPTEFAAALVEAAQAYITDEELYAEARSLFDEGSWRDALARFEHLEELTPGYRETRLYLERARRQVQLLDLFEAARKLLERGAYKPCLDKLDVLAQLAPNYDVKALREQARLAWGEHLYRQATQLYQSGEYQGCLRVFEQIWDTDPSFHDKENIAEQARRLLERQQYLKSLYDISVEQTQAEDWTAALQTLEELYREAPYYADVEARLTMIRYIARLSRMYGVAQERFGAGRYVECIEQLDELKQVNDEYKSDHVARLRDQAAEALYRRAVQFLEDGQFERALVDLDDLDACAEHIDTSQVRIRAEEGHAAKELRSRLDSMYDQAARCLDLRQYSACLDMLTEIYRIDSGYPDDRYLERQALEGKCSLLYAETLGALVRRRYREAESLWDQIQSLDPAYPDPQDVHGQIVKGLRKWKWLRPFQRAGRDSKRSPEVKSLTLPPAATPTSAPVVQSAPEIAAEEPPTLSEHPGDGAREVDVDGEGEPVALIGRTEDPEYRRRSSLPAVDVEDLPAPTSKGDLVVPLGDLEIVHIASAAVRGEKGWTAFFEVKIAGGDGCNYRVYWNQEPVEFTVKPMEPDVAVIRRPGAQGTISGTVWVESGDQRVALQTSLQVPEYPQSL